MDSHEARAELAVAVVRQHSLAAQAHVERVSHALRTLRARPATDSGADGQPVADAVAAVSGVLADLSALLVEEADPDAILRRIAELAVAVMPGPVLAGVTVSRSGQPQTVASTNPLVTVVDGHQYRIGAGPCLDSLRVGHPHHLSAVPDARWPRFSQLLADHGLHSMVSVPLASSRERIGALNVYAAAPLAFSRTDRQVLRLLAEQSAAVFLQARAFREQRQIAEVLQRSLLPAVLPAPSEVRLAARYRGAATGSRVGGDWYDAVLLPGGAVGLTIGDVAGHGVPAAATMGRLRTMLRAYALEGHPPATAIDGLREYLRHDDVTGVPFATCCMVLLDPATSALRWCNAGHLPPVLAHPGGRAVLLDGTHAPPLGVGQPLPPAAEGARALPAGARLLLYTDGLVERRGEGLDAGLRRLLHTATTTPYHAGEPDALGRWCDEILARQLDREDPPVADDIALLAAALG